MSTTATGRRPRFASTTSMGCCALASAGSVSLPCPDYLIALSPNLRQVLPALEGPTFTAYFVYPEELRTSKRVAVFRDFLLEKVKAHAIW